MVSGALASIAQTRVDETQCQQSADDRLIARYGQRIPRYTSYPTALQFTPSVDAACYRQWLSNLFPAAAAAIPSARPSVSLYIHIPFCDVMCWYCGCHTSVVNKRSPVEDYVAHLLREIALVAQAIPHKLAVSSVHFGGGSPNMLSPGEFSDILGALRQRFDFQNTIEIAAELDPRLITREWVQTAVNAGLNRASLGVQDFDAAVQTAINRVQPYDLVKTGVDLLRAHNVRSLNLDLIYGLPRQSLAGVEETIDRALALDPDRLSLFGYAHVPWMKAHQKLIADCDLPSPKLRMAMQRRAARLLEERGWIRLGLDHFAKPDDGLASAAADGRMRRNFQGYTTDESSALIGFGASSIGRTVHGYAQNESATPQWRAKIQRGELPIARGVALTPDDRFRGDIIERLMCDFTVDLADACARHRRDLTDLEDARVALVPMQKDGLLNFHGAQIIATPLGRDFIRSISAVFDAHLAHGGARHSTGV